MKLGRETAWIFVAGVLFGFLGAGLLFLAASPPRGEPVRLDQPLHPRQISVHVAGSVTRPGVYNLEPGSRVSDAVAAAGGVLPAGNEQALNLAGLLADGDRVYVPARAQPVSANQPVSPGETVVAPAGRLVNINLAGQSELETLPGIGPSLATRIIAHRDQNGPFAMIDAILEVSGIGPAKFEGIRDLITVEDGP
jgi:competence protein ComEA